jgi:hypothetical protein
VLRITDPRLGRKLKEQKEAAYYKNRKRKNEAAHRNPIAIKFGPGKNGYKLNKINAKLKARSTSWLAASCFVMNLINGHKIKLSGLIFSSSGDLKPAQLNLEV